MIKEVEISVRVYQSLNMRLYIGGLLVTLQ